MRMTFGKKAFFLILPILGIVSAVYTYDAIKTEKEIFRTEIIKRAEAITTLATRAGELPVLSGNPELLKGVMATLRANSEVSSLAFFDNKMELLIQEGIPIAGQLPALSPDVTISMLDTGGQFVFYAPMFTVRPREDIDIFHADPQSGELRENIGWVRLGFSKDAMYKGARKIVIRGFLLALIFTVGSSIAVFILITIATKPLVDLSHAAKKLEKGEEYPEIRNISSTDEVGALGAAFNKMSMAIKERESKLVESENRMSELFERVEHAIFRLDADGTIISANAKFRDLFGQTDLFADILLGEERVRDCFQKAMAGSAVHLEESARGRGASELMVLLSLYPALGGEGVLKGYDGYLIDITEKKELEERLLRSQKLTAVGTLAGGMAHDFNNLLQAILGYSEMMLDMTNEGDLFNRPVKIIHHAAKRGAELTKMILSVTRKEKMEIRRVDLNEIVRSSVELLGRSIPKNIEIVVNTVDGIPKIMGDPSQLQQVILNLTVNARDAMPDGGRLTIGTSLAEGQEGPDASGLAAGRFVELTISDNGSGMDRATRERIFEPFFTTKDAGKGTGLGLYMVHSIIDNHGGYINVHSETRKGTCFNIFLPVGESDFADAPPGIKEIAGSETVLVIDDDASVRDVYNDMLTRLGYTVMAADGAASGLHQFREKKEEIALVILDMMMPETSGIETYRLLKSIRPDVKILLCSGYSPAGYEGMEGLIREGAAGFLQKPFCRNDIAAAIRTALSKKQDAS